MLHVLISLSQPGGLPKPVRVLGLTSFESRMGYGAMSIDKVLEVSSCENSSNTPLYPSYDTHNVQQLLCVRSCIFLDYHERLFCLLILLDCSDTFVIIILFCFFYVTGNVSRCVRARYPACGDRQPPIYGGNWEQVSVYCTLSNFV